MCDLQQRKRKLNRRGERGFGGALGARLVAPGVVCKEPSAITPLSTPRLNVFT